MLDSHYDRMTRLEHLHTYTKMRYGYEGYICFNETLYEGYNYFNETEYESYIYFKEINSEVRLKRNNNVLFPIHTIGYILHRKESLS